MNFEIFKAKVKVQWGKLKAFCAEKITLLKAHPIAMKAVISAA